MTKADCDLLGKYWGIGLVQSVQVPETGTMNTIRVLETDSGKYVLRVYRHQNHQRILCEHQVVHWVAEQGLPAVAPLRTLDGETFVVHEDRFVTLLPFVAGRQVVRGQFQIADVEAIGRFLGVLHQTLEAYPIADVPRVKNKIEPEKTLAGIDRVERLVRNIKDPQPTDEYALARLISRRAWLENRTHDNESQLDTLPFQVVHGDYQETNLFFEQNEVSAIIDWDKVYAAPAVWEVARALHLMFQFDSVLSCVFLAAYRTSNDLSLDSLDLAVQAYGLMRAYDLWLFEEIYEAGNDRVRQFMRPGKFVPISDEWARLRPAVEAVF